MPFSSLKGSLLYSRLNAEGADRRQIQSKALPTTENPLWSFLRYLKGGRVGFKLSYSLSQVDTDLNLEVVLVVWSLVMKTLKRLDA